MGPDQESVGGPHWDHATQGPIEASLTQPTIALRVHRPALVHVPSLSEQQSTSPFCRSMPRPSPGRPHPAPVFVHPPRDDGDLELLPAELVQRDAGVGCNGGEEVPKRAGGGG